MIDFHPHAQPCPRCNAARWERIDTQTPRKGGPEDVLECVFCGVMLRVPAVAVARAAPTDDAEFRFKYGRFTGLTLAEADEQPNGRKYLEWMAANNETLKDRVGQFLTLVADSANERANTRGQDAGPQ
jgi:hypothetical protein